MAGLLPPLVQEIRGNASQLILTYKVVETEADKMAGTTDAAGNKITSTHAKIASAANKMGQGVLLAGAAIIGLSVAAAVAAQNTEAKLNTAIKNTGANLSVVTPKIDAAEASNRKFGYTNDQTAAALAASTTALGSPTKALAQLSVATDIARAKNIDLSQATLLVARASEGNTRILKQNGIDLNIVGGSATNVAAAQLSLSNAQQKVNDILAKTPGAANAGSKAHASYVTATQAVDAAQTKLTATQSAGGEALDALSSRYKGSATASSKTLEGQLRAMGAQFDNVGQKIGTVLIPYLQKAVTAVSGFFGFLQKNQGVATAIAIGIGVIAAAFAAYSIASGIATVATALFGAAQGAALAPALIVIAVIAAVIAIIILLVTHWKQVTEFLQTTWKAVAGWFKSVGDTIVSWWNGFWNGLFKFVDTIFKAEVDGWKLIFKSVYDFFVTVGTDIQTWWTGLWTGIVDWLTGYWQKAVTFYTGVFQNVLTVFQSIGTNIKKWWTGFWSGLGSLASGIFKNTFNFVTTIINDVINAINTITSALNTAGGAIGINIKIGKIPHLPSFDVGTSGVPGPTGAPLLAVVHGGEPVLSNKMMSGQAQIPQNVVQAVNNQQGQSAGGSSGGNIYATFNTNASPAAILGQLGWLKKRMG